MSASLTFDAANLARGWLSVLQAAGTDPKDPGPFYRSVHVEFYAGGVRLTATDRRILLTAWVPRLDHEDDPPPHLDEDPVAATVALDLAQRGKGLFRYAYPLAVDPDRHDPLPVVLTVEKAQDEAQGQLPFEDFEGELVVFDLPGMERLRLRVFGGTYPNWRGQFAQHSRKRTTAIALATDALQRLAVLGDWNGGPLTWEFGGINAVARVAIGDGPVIVEGLVMPDRWEPKLDDMTAATVEEAMDEGLRRAVDEAFGDDAGDGGDGSE